MNEEEKIPVKRVISVKTLTVETTFGSYPQEEMQSDIEMISDGDTLRVSGEPEPFDPYDIDRPQREAAEKQEAPTPESVAEDLKAATFEGVEYESDNPEPEQSPAQAEPEEDIPAPTPTPSEKKKLKKLKRLKDSKPVSIAFLVFIMIICLAIFVIGVAMFLRSIWEAKNTTETPAGSSAPVAVRKLNPYRRIAGVWESQAEGGSCYVFAPDKKSFWLQSCENFSDNYYYGDVVVKNDSEALIDLGITIDQAFEVVGLNKGDATLDNVYSIHLVPTELVSEGEDKTETASELKLLFVYLNENEARGFLYNTGDSYMFSKRADVKVPTRKKCGQTYYDFNNFDSDDAVKCAPESEELTNPAPAE